MVDKDTHMEHDETYRKTKLGDLGEAEYVIPEKEHHRGTIYFTACDYVSDEPHIEMTTRFGPVTGGHVFDGDEAREIGRELLLAAEHIDDVDVLTDDRLTHLRNQIEAGLSDDKTALPDVNDVARTLELYAAAVRGEQIDEQLIPWWGAQNAE